MREPWVCGGVQQGPWSAHGDTVPGHATGWALAIPIWGPETGWVQYPVYHPPGTPPTALPRVLPLPCTTRMSPPTSTSRLAVTARLRSTKEILGVGYAHGYSGHAGGCVATGATLRLQLFGPPSAPTPSEFSVFLSISQYISY